MRVRPVRSQMPQVTATHSRVGRRSDPRSRKRVAQSCAVPRRSRGHSGLRCTLPANHAISHQLSTLCALGYAAAVEPPLVAGLGRIGVAISALAPNLPEVGAAPADLAALSTAPATGIAVALRAALRLGCRARAAGTHGADLLGQLARTALRDAGIDVELLRPVGTSACELVTVAGDGTLRTRYHGDRGEPVKIDATAALGG